MAIVPTARWYVFQTKYNTEFLAEKQLIRQHFETCVPSMIVDKLRLGVVIGHEKRALFGSYGFVRFNISTDHWRPICSTYGVHRLFGTTPDCPIPVPEGVIESLQQAISTPTLPDEIIVAAPVEPALAVDDLGEVLGGPFAGHVGLVQSSERGRVVLLLNILQSQRPIIFKRVNVRKFAELSHGTQTAHTQ